jgi:hypothetical protein
MHRELFTLRVVSQLFLATLAVMPIFSDLSAAQGTSTGVGSLGSSGQQRPETVNPGTNPDVGTGCTDSAPTFGQQPLSGAATEGQSATLSASVAGCQNIVWQKFNSAMAQFESLAGTEQTCLPSPQTTTTSYVINPVQLFSTGNYRVLAVNGCAQSTSALASLTVNPEPLDEVTIISPTNNSFINISNVGSALNVTGNCNIKAATVNVAMGSVSNTATCDGTNYSTTLTGLTALADGNLSLTATMGTASASITMIKDTVRPTVSISAPSASVISSGGSATFTVSYSGASNVSLSNAQITVNSPAGMTGCAASVSGAGTSTRTVTLTGCSVSSTASVNFSIASNSAQDAAGNQAASAGPSNNVDVNPTANITITSPLTGSFINIANVGNVLTVTGTCNLSGAAVSVTLGSLSNSTTCNGTNYSTTLTGLAALADGSLTLTATMNAASASISLIKDTVAPTLAISSPSSTSVNSGGSVSYTVNYSGADTISLNSSYVNIQSMPALSSCAISVSPSGNPRTITLSGCTAPAGAAVSAIISIAAGTATDSAGNSADASQPSLAFSVQGSGCPLPGAPTLSTPSNSATSVELVPNLSWSGLSLGITGCEVRYNVRVVPSSQTCVDNEANAVTTSNTSLAWSTLDPATSYRWCVRSDVVQQGAGVLWGSWSQVFQFSTTSATPGVATGLYTIPASSPSNPRGNRYIIVGASISGEAGSTAIFKEITTTGAQIVGSPLIPSGNNGQIEIAVDVEMHSPGAGERKYFVQIQRPNNGATGSPSSSVSYFYDPALSPGLDSPALEKNGSSVGSLIWTHVVGATGYKIWRRIGLEDALSSGEWYQNIKPFKLIASLTNPMIQNGQVTWMDPAAPAPDADGISYFVTALNATEQSDRSNAQSFGDQTGPTRRDTVDASGLLLQQVRFISQPSGRDAVGFLCNIHQDGYLGGVDHGENSPDLFSQTQVKLKSADTACENEDYEQNSIATILPFDAIKSYTDNTLGIQNCLKVGTISNLEPNTTYCIKSCLLDSSNNREVNCLEGKAFDQGDDIVAPTFAGIKSAEPMEDGLSIKVKWDTPITQDSQEPINYKISYTQTYNENGVPVFPNDGTSRVTDDENATELTVDQLDTGEPYCFKVTVYDNYQNSSDGNGKYLCTQTLNNAPILDALTITRDSNDAYKFLVNFRVLDRETNDGIVIKSLSFKTAEGSQWIEMSSRHFSGDSFLASGDSVATAPMHTIVTDTLAYFSGEKQGFQLKFEIEDSSGNRATVTSRAVTILRTMSANSSFAKSVACGQIGAHREQNQDQLPFVILLAALLSAALLMRRGLTA